LREEQQALALADLAGPLRVAAALLLELQGRPAGSPREALAAAAASSGLIDAPEAVRRLSEARDARRLEPGIAALTTFALLDLVAHLRARADELE
jgi:hypothetical protein